jgi:NADPH:quinone reductase-like Zn-dependent oxidoreductase
MSPVFMPRSGGSSLVDTTVWMPAPDDEERGVRGIDLFVRSDAGQLAALVDRGELRVDVAERVPLAELPDVRARAASGALRGKVVVLAAA